MERKLILQVFALFCIKASAVQAADPQPPSTLPLPAGATAWKLILNDTFDGTVYDTSIWNPYADWGGNGSFNNGREKYYVSQIKLAGGICNLVAQPNPTVSGFTGSYQSGELISARKNTSSTTPYKFDFLYGYIEARIKIVDKPGFFTAFWMVPSKKDYNYEWEIDILEQLGGQNKTMFQTYHYSQGLVDGVARNTSWTPNNGLNNNGAAPVLDYSNDFHTFGVDWQPDHLTFYIDGIASGTFPNKGTSNANIARTRGYILIQQMVENNWGRSWDLLVADTSSTKDTLQVDYVRVWQGTSTTGIMKGNPVGPDADKNMQVFLKNPMRGQVAFTVKGGPRNEVAAVNVYDELGRLVRRMTGIDPVWSGRDEQGRSVKSGCYFYSVDRAGRIQAGKIMYVR